MLKDRIECGALALSRAVRELYAAGQTDYSMEPLVLADEGGEPVGRIHAGDGVIFCCRRGEREVELTEAFTDPGFDRFPRPDQRDLTFVILTLYHEKFKDLPVAFAPARIPDTLAEVISRAGLRQLHTSESEKFAHVTFFFNGGNNEPFPGEQDVRVPSLRGVPFEQAPALSLPQVSQEVLRGIHEGVDFIAANFANGDVIGHTANREAKLACASIVDRHLGSVADAALARGYVVFVTADHGNLEELVTPEGKPHVSHTTNPVSLILLDPRATNPVYLRDGKLADVAPSVLAALDIPQPAAMTGANLAPDHDGGGRRRVLLLILDGWGMGQQDDTNPIFLAPTPRWDDLLRRFGSSTLQASGEAVGLKPGKPGNSEAGHLNLGAGRVVLQDDVRLDAAMEDGSFQTNPIFLQTIEDVKRRGANLHLIGLLSEKSSHGSIEYPLALLRMAKEHGLERAFVHLIFDGRSTEPGSAPSLLDRLEDRIAEIGIGTVVTGMGRAVALDRDGNYTNIQRAYEAMVLGKGRLFTLD